MEGMHWVCSERHLPLVREKERHQARLSCGLILVELTGDLEWEQPTEHTWGSWQAFRYHMTASGTHKEFYTLIPESSYYASYMVPKNKIKIPILYL